MHDDTNTAMITGGPLRPHEYVMVKRELTARDEAWIADHMVKGNATDMAGGQSTFTLGSTQLATLQRVIVGWNISKVTRRDGREFSTPIPFSVEAIGDLPGKIYRYIVMEYARIAAEVEGEDKESDTDFTHAASDGSAGSSKPVNEDLMRL